MSPPRGKRLIDPLDDTEISGIEAVRCYLATTHVYYLTVNNRSVIQNLNTLLKTKAVFIPEALV
jgi:hypothetical protein